MTSYWNRSDAWFHPLLRRCSSPTFQPKNPIKFNTFNEFIFSFIRCLIQRTLVAKSLKNINVWVKIWTVTPLFTINEFLIESTFNVLYDHKLKFLFMSNLEWVQLQSIGKWGQYFFGHILPLKSMLSQQEQKGLISWAYI